MATVDLTLPHHRYQIVIEPGLLARGGELIHRAAPHQRAAVLADGAVIQKYGDQLQGSLQKAGYAVVGAKAPSGEDHKNLETAARMLGFLTDARLERKSPVIALGGGVVGDTVGFVAATYLRGVPFIQCPTTLLAMVDASVGGKVGVNLPQGKNLVGAFHQPNLVLIDTDTLATLPERELRCGLAECVKHGMIRDEKRFAWIEDNLDAILALDPEALVELVRWNVQIKANVVMADEKEAGERAHLNFGHTFAHAIEATAGYATHTYHHGEAVSLGMVAATRLAVDTGRVPAALHDRLVRLLARIGLPIRGHLAPTPQLVESMRLDKKVADGKFRLVLPDRFGAVSIVNDTEVGEIEKAWEAVRD